MRRIIPARVLVAAVLSLPGCRDAQPPTTPFGPDGVAEPALGVGMAAEEGFSFLAPLVKGPRPEGELDPTLSPVVEVCRPAGLGCSVPLVAQFTMQGDGSERVRLERDQHEHYHVNWHTGRFDLDPAVPYRIRVRVGGSTLGHLDVALVETGGGKKRTGDGPATVQLGSTVPIKFHIAKGAVPAAGVPQPVPNEPAAASAVIGPNGGTLTATDQAIRYTLEIPAGALPREETITMTPLLGVHNFPLSGGLAAGVHLQPDGLILYRAGTLTIELPEGSHVRGVTGFGYVGGGELVYAQPAERTGNRITLLVSHFSGAGAAAASSVDLQALVAYVSSQLNAAPSNIYPIVMAFAEQELALQICGGPDPLFDCDPGELQQYVSELPILRARVIDDWYTNGLLPILRKATEDDAALEVAVYEFFAWAAQLQMLPGVPQNLAGQRDQGFDYLADGFFASMQRFADDCQDGRVADRWAEAQQATLLGRAGIPTTLRELALRFTCTSFEIVRSPATLGPGQTDTLEFKVVRASGALITELYWPDPLTLEVSNGCGKVDGRFTRNDVQVAPGPLTAEVELWAEQDPACTEIVVPVRAFTYVPDSTQAATSPPPFNGVVFGAEDTVRIAIAGRKILFTKSAGGTLSLIHTVAPDGSGLTALVPGAYARWDPDGKRVVYGDYKTLDLRMMDADGSNQRTIVRGQSSPLVVNWYPAWSPDGSNIAFSRRLQPQSGGPVSNEIYTVNADGSGLTRMTDSPDDQIDKYHPTWSPDGTRIAYMAHKGGTNWFDEIRVVHLDGSGTRTLAGPGLHPDWSSDGRIAYLHPSGAASSIYVMNGDGSGKTYLATARPGRLAWSPDASRIAFVGEHASGGTAIFVTNLDGSGITQVPGTEGAGYVDW